ncbi:arylsulfatase [Arthrobacter sp. D1-29]
MTEPTQRPNVVLILADDLGWGDVGCNGAERISTPHIDSLAQQGTRFTDVHSASAVCTPSRYALLTGQYSWRTRLKKRVLMGHAPALIESGTPTVASVLHGCGYRTAAIGKWHLGLGWRHKDGTKWKASNPDHPLELESVGTDSRLLLNSVDTGDTIDYTKAFEDGPLEVGFDRFFGIAGSLDMPPYCFLEQDRTVGIPAEPKREYLTEQRPGLQTPDWDEHQVDLRFTSEAVRFIEEAPSEQPFFLYFAPSAPHRPQVPPEFLRGTSQAGPRGDSVAFVDWMTGQILEALDRTGRSQDTVVIFTSDNGAPTVYDDGDTTIHRPNGPWRGQKGDLWDGGHREPFIVRWAGTVPANAVSDQLLGLVDMLPTLAALVGADLPELPVDGVDVSPALLGEPCPPRVLVHHSMEGSFSVRDGSWKALFSTGSGGGFSEPAGVPVTAEEPGGQLYDLATDPDEQENLWERHPEQRQRMQGLLEDIIGPDAAIDAHAAAGSEGQSIDR